VTRALAVLAAALLTAAPAGLTAQATELGRQTLGRAYWHVFIAYALAILFIGGWVISIARRLARVERRLDGE
jgi:CcmD family protein